MRLLDTTGGWRGLASGLGGELLAWGFATSGLACEVLLVMFMRRVVVVTSEDRQQAAEVATPPPRTCDR